MAILNYTTKVDASKTIGEIMGLLSKKGAQKMVIDYSDGEQSAVTFMLTLNGQNVFFALPCRRDGVLKAMKKDPKVPLKLCTNQQALRVGWRIVKDWVEAQLAIVEAQLAELPEVFLPYAVTKNGSTLYDRMKSDGNQLLLGG